MNWSQYSLRLPSDEEMSSWQDNYPHSNIGLVTGPASGVCAFDYDYEYNEHKSKQEDERAFKKDKRQIDVNVLPLMLPKSPLSKVGLKGFTNIYRIKHSDKIKNTACDRHGVRCFDFKYIGQQIVVPPSIHPDNNKPYVWTGDCVENVSVEDLPYLNFEAIIELELLLKTGRKDTLGGRHGKIFKYALDIINIAKSDEELVSRMIAFDKKINEVPYLEDKKYFRTSDPVINANSWIPRINSFSENNKKMNKEIGAKSPYHAFEIFFDKQLKTPVKEKLSKVLKFEHQGKWVPVENEIRAIKSYAAEAGLKKHDVEDNLARYTHEKEGKLLVEFQEWDGKDRIHALRDYIKLKGQEWEMVEDLFKDWGMRCFNRIKDCNEQNRCIIIKGNQGIGKDRFIKNHVSAFGIYYKTLAPQTSYKDYLATFSRTLVMHIEEFDQTNKSFSLNQLKNMITQSDAEFREPYARQDSEHEMHCSFISSVNFDDVLKDPTGNRRFIIFDVESINWGYEKNSPQILAQFRAMHQSGWTCKQEYNEEMTRQLKKYEVLRVEEHLLPQWDNEVENLFRHRPHDDRLRRSDMEHVVKELAIAYKTFRGAGGVYAILKENGRSRKDMHGIYFLRDDYKNSKRT